MIASDGVAVEEEKNLIEDKVVLITGAGRGIGRGIAQAVVEAGGRVVAADIDEGSASETVELLGGEGRALAVAVDVVDGLSVGEAIERTVAHFGRLDGLVNNAGAVRMDAALDVTADDWDLQFDVNVKGLFTCCQYAARRMIAQGDGGAIVNISSNAGKAGYPNMVAYNASKAAVISITRSLAAEWATERINVNAICPGGVDAPMLASCAEWIGERAGDDPGELIQGMTAGFLGRHVQPLEVGRLAAFLLSDRAELIRGQSISADGGATPY